MSRKPSKPETRIEDYLDVMTGGNVSLPQPILRIEFYYAFLAGMAVELPQPILDDEKLLAKICGMAVEAPTYIPGLFPRLYAYMAKKGGQDVQVPDPILRLERYWYDYSAGEAPSVQEYTGAVPLTFVADGTPLLDYLISGNTVQNGTPSPDSPVMPQGTGDKTANLFDKSKRTDNSRVVYTTGEIGALNGVFVSDFTPIEPNTTYTLNIVSSISGKTGHLFALYDENKNFVNTGAHEASLATVYIFTTPSNVAYIRFNGNMASVNEIMLNLGSNALPYEPYGYKIPISSANTTTPIYLGEVQTTRKIKKLVLDGTENWALEYTDNFLLNTAIDNAQPLQLVVCTHQQSISTGYESDTNFENVRISQTKKLNFRTRTIPHNLSDFKSYLAQQYAAGTPVTVWCVLAEPETGIVNEPLMKIGDYADTLSMEQAGVQIPTANGSTTLDVETVVKPSEVYIKYRGEAVTTLSALLAEVSSPEAVPEEENPEETEEEENER